MSDDINETTPTTEESADEAATSVSSPADDAPSPADSSTEGAVEAEDGAEAGEGTPEQKVEREKAERAKKRIADAEQADKRAEAARIKRQREREETERNERVAFRERQLDALLRESKALKDSLEAKAAAVAKGGVEALRALGIEYGEWTRSELEERGPDAIAQKALAEAKKLREELAQRDEQSKKAKEQEAREAGVKRFESFAETNAEDFPSAATLPSRMFRALADEAAQEFISEHGYAPSFGLLLPLLDKKAEEFHKELSTKAAKRTQPATTPIDGTTPQAKPGQPANAPANRTLTPALAGTRAKPPREMTEEEIDEWARNELRTAMAADRKASKLA